MIHHDYLCRIGVHGQVGRFRSIGGLGRVDRGTWMVCRSERGLEAAEVMVQVERSSEAEVDGQILRRMTQEDQLLWKQLCSLSQLAMESCQKWLEEKRVADILLEVDPLLDGRTLYFHFLGEPTLETESMVDGLARRYQEEVSSSRFSQLLEHGCGPDCGTESKGGCGSGACAVCTVASACKR